MGASGYKLLDDDSVLDVYEAYMSQFDTGLDPAAIRVALESSFADFRTAPVDGFLFWFGLAQAQWECGALDQDVLDKVAEAVAQGIDLKRWSGSDAEKRRKILERFIAMLRVAKAKPRLPQVKPKRKGRYISAIYEPGDCLALHLANGQYAAAIVLVAVGSAKEDGSNLLGLIHYLEKEPPALHIFMHRRYVQLTHHSFNGYLSLWWCGARGHKNYSEDIALVGHVDLSPDDPQPTPFGIFGSEDWDIGQQMVFQYRWDQGFRD